MNTALLLLIIATALMFLSVLISVIVRNNMLIQLICLLGMSLGTGMFIVLVSAMPDKTYLFWPILLVIRMVQMIISITRQLQHRI